MALENVTILKYSFKVYFQIPKLIIQSLNNIIIMENNVVYGIWKSQCFP